MEHQDLAATNMGSDVGDASGGGPGGDTGVASLRMLPISVKTISQLLEIVSGLEERLDALENNKPSDTISNKARTETAGADATDADLPWKSCITYRRKMYNKETGRTQYMDDTHSEAEPISRGKLLRQDTNAAGEIKLSILRTEDNGLYDRFQGICPATGYGEVTVLESRIKIISPFPLLHCQKKLENLKESSKDAASKLLHQEVSMLLQYCQQGRILQAHNTVQELMDRKDIDFENIRGLFGMDDLVVSKELRDQWVVRRVIRISGLEGNSSTNLKELTLTCESINSDGQAFRYTRSQEVIEYFPGTRKITELSIYPLEMHPTKEELIKQLIARGTEWKCLQDSIMEKGSAQTRDYRGYCLTFDKDKPDDADISGRVIVDSRKFAELDVIFLQEKKAPIWPEKGKETKYDRNPYLLAPASVVVYSLDEHDWYTVAIARLNLPSWPKDADGAWKRLVKAKPQEGLINRLRVLAKAHQSQKKDGGDSISNLKGKGRGFVVLLSGPPGVGKTMTAEILADIQRRPLYRVNLGTLTESGNMEQEIERIFRKAHSWDAILLIDEAEVLLAERTQENMIKSAWVAVLLRKIEYFEGLLILTTNLIHNIDHAFESRINIGIQFSEFKSDDRETLWKQFLEDKLTFDSTLDAKVKAWANEKLNGRQIRNIVSSAVLLAAGEERSLTVDDIDTILRDTTEFVKIIRDEKQKVEMSFLPQWSSGYREI